MLEQRIQQQFFDSADLKYRAAEALASAVAAASSALIGCLTAGGKVLAAAPGASAALAQQAAIYLVSGFERERPPLAAWALGADAGVQGALASRASTLSWPAVLALQVHALGNPGDVLLAFAGPGEDEAMKAVVQAAHEKEMTVVAFTARHGGALGEQLSETDVLLAVPHESAPRVREMHLLLLHGLCDAIDTQLLGETDTP